MFKTAVFPVRREMTKKKYYGKWARNNLIKDSENECTKDFVNDSYFT